MIARVLVVLLIGVELVALLAPARNRPLFVVVPGFVPGNPAPDANTTLLAASTAGDRFLHEMTADDVARGIWGLDRAGIPVSVDPAEVAEAARLHRELGALRARRRAAAEVLAADGVVLAGWAWR